MKIIIGLGNPGAEYESTRHNTGFFFVDKIKSSWSFPAFEFNKKLNCEVSKNVIIGKEILIVKPSTFMNLSGVATKNILDFYKLTPDDIIVIHDDLDIAIGKYRVAPDSSSAGHHGVENIIEKLGTQKFTRIRIGIGKETEEGAIACRLDAKNFVLQKFSPEELEKIEKISDTVLEEIEKIV